MKIIQRSDGKVSHFEKLNIGDVFFLKATECYYMKILPIMGGNAVRFDRLNSCTVIISDDEPVILVEAELHILNHP